MKTILEVEQVEKSYGAYSQSGGHSFEWMHPSRVLSGGKSCPVGEQFESRVVDFMRRESYEFV